MPNAVAYDPGTGKGFLFYGQYAQSRVDTWTYDVRSNSLRESAETETPPQLTGYAAAYDDALGKVLVFGFPMYAESVETWTYDPATGSWADLHPAVSPPALQGAGMAYYPGLDSVVLFGGTDRSSAAARLWVYDAAANTWTELKTEDGPSARVDAAMAYDEKSARLLVFGGMEVLQPDPESEVTLAPGPGLLADTWAYDAKTNAWTRLKPAVSPPPMLAAMMAYDASAGKTILFGGQAYDGMYHDTWAYDSQVDMWTELNTAGAPGGRLGALMFYDKDSQRVILWGGFDEHGVEGAAWSFTY
jgi:hypothetical protein